MKVFIVFCVIAHLTVAIVPPFTNILSGGGLGGLLGGGGGGASESEGSSSSSIGNPLSAISGLLNAESGRRVLGDVLGVKINLLSALRDTVAGNQEIDISEGGGEVVDGMGGGLGIEESAQAYSSGSGFDQMDHSASGYQTASNGGYSYNPPSQSAGYAPQIQNTYGAPSSGSGYAADGGYAYNRPSTAAGYASNGNSFSSHSRSNDFSNGAVEHKHDSGVSATQSGSAGFSSNSNGNKGHTGGTLGKF